METGFLADQESQVVYVVDSKGTEIESFRMGIIESLVKYLCKEIDTEIFPDDAVLDRKTHVFAVEFGTTFED